MKMTIENNTKYKGLHFLTFHTYRELEEAGFVFSDSSEGVKYYSLRFPVCFWSKIPTLFGYLTVNSDTMEVTVDVKTPNNVFYADFYNNEFGDSEKILTEIHRRINSKLKELGIVRKKFKKTKEILPNDIKKQERNSYDRARSKENRGSDKGSTECSAEVLPRQERHRDRPKRRKPFRKVLPENG